MKTVPQATAECGSFWWRDVCKLMDKFREFTCVQVNQGDTVLFWDDNWQLDNSMVPLKQRFARLFSFAIDSWARVKDYMEC